MPSPGVRAGSHILVEDSDEGEEEKDLLKEWIEIEEEQEEVREEKMEVREVEMELLERGVDSQQDEVMSQQEEGEMGLEEEDVEVETDLVVTRVVVDSPARPTTEEEDYMYGDEPEPQIVRALPFVQTSASLTPITHHPAQCDPRPSSSNKFEPATVPSPLPPPLPLPLTRTTSPSPPLPYPLPGSLPTHSSFPSPPIRR